MATTAAIQPRMKQHESWLWLALLFFHYDYYCCYFAVGHFKIPRFPHTYARARARLFGPICLSAALILIEICEISFVLCVVCLFVCGGVQ